MCSDNRCHGGSQHGYRDPEGSEHCCRGRGAQPEGFVVPCLLLLLLERPAHGYDLVERLGTEFSLAPLDPTGVYRNLRRLEADGYIASTWETSEAGPARRTYRVTPEGEEYLALWAETIGRNRRVLDSFLERYDKFVGKVR